jgi:hypothetical protein
MPKIRDILRHVSVETAQRRRKCRRNDSRSILKGEACLVVLTGATNDPYSYSKENAKPILDHAFQKLCGFYRELELPAPEMEWTKVRE